MKTPFGETGFANTYASIVTGVGIASRATGRAFIVVLIVGAAIAVGLATPMYFHSWIASLPPAGLALGGAALLGVLRGLFESLPTAWDFVVDADDKSLPKIFAQVAVAALGLGFAYYAASGPEPRSLSLNFGGPPPPLLVNESDALLTAYVTFGEKRAVLDNPQIELVNNLVDSLVTCLESPTDQVSVLVRGYASSSGPDSDNDALYKDREALVAKLISDRVVAQGKSSQFTVEVRDWKSLQIMKMRRLFKDTDEKGTYLLTAGALNRRAEIRVRAAGACLPG